MFRRTAILGLSLALGAAAPLVLAVDAEAPATTALSPAAAATASADTPAAAPPVAPPADGGKAAVPPKFVRTDCTGTRIRPAAGKPCSPPSTLLRSYSQQDLQRTGQIQIGDALRMLDPIFR